MKEDIYSTLSSTEWLEDLHTEIEFDISIIHSNDVEKEILLDDEINEHLASLPYKNGLWYQSGRSYFHDEDDQENEEGYIVEVAPKDTH